jgi:diacylglycerol kinase (ATP)
VAGNNAFTYRPGRRLCPFRRINSRLRITLPAGRPFRETKSKSLAGYNNSFQNNTLWLSLGQTLQVSKVLLNLPPAQTSWMGPQINTAPCFIDEILLISGGEMRVAAIIGLGSSAKHLHPFARTSDAHWQLGLPASTSEADAILLLGGDGTVHRHLVQLVKLQLPVLVVPCGSGNDFARALKLRSFGDALDAWRKFASGQENVRPIDLGVISPPPTGDATSSSAHQPGHYFCCVGGIGLDVEIARRANQLPRWIRRNGGYALSLLPALRGFEPLPVTVQAQPDAMGVLAVRHHGPAVVVAFANTSTYGGGFKIAPEARLDDGKLDICVVGSMSKARLLRLFPSVYSGRHLSLPEVQYFQAERLRLETEQPMEVYADGEYVCRTPIEVTVERTALRVIVSAGF